MIGSKIWRGALMALALTCAASPVLAKPTGEHPVRLERDRSLPYHTLFRPVTLVPKTPVVVFAGGGCRNAGSRFRELLSEVASHGYLVIALGEIGEPDWDASLEREPRFNGRPTKTDVSQIPWAIDWATKENVRKGSRYFGKLDLAKLAVMGQSCGGMQALDFASRDPRVRTLVVLNSGTFPDDREMGGTEIKRADLPKIKAPTLILLGGKDDVAWQNGLDTFALMTAPTFLADAPYGHRATYFEPNGGLYGTVVVDWLAWRLKDDLRAQARFVGSDCGLCKDSRWTLKQRGIDGLALIF